MHFQARRLHLRHKPGMRLARLKNAAVVLVGLALAALGIYNIVLKATFTLMDDGVFWINATDVEIARDVHQLFTITTITDIFIRWQERASAGRHGARVDAPTG